MLRKEEPCGPEDALTIVYESAEYELYSISEELHVSFSSRISDTSS